MTNQQPLIPEDVEIVGTRVPTIPVVMIFYIVSCLIGFIAGVSLMLLL